MHSAACQLASTHRRLPDSAIVNDADDRQFWLHLQVNAAVGCLARLPLPHAAFKPPVQQTASWSPQGQRQQGLERSASRFGSELWAPYLRDTALRVFGSVGVAGQLGHFCRPVLDFTAGAPSLPCLLCKLLQLLLSQVCISMLFSQVTGQKACNEMPAKLS